MRRAGGMAEPRDMVVTMCHPSVVAFGARHLDESEIRDKQVLEVGSRVVLEPELTLRHHVEALGPSSYVGVDLEPGYGVDEICDATRLRDRFGDESFDTVISTELLEHVRDWRSVVSNMKHVVRPGGVLLLTTRSFGFPYHAWPYDFWRFELDDMRSIFCDFDIVEFEADPQVPGVLLKAVRPETFTEVDPSVDMYSVIRGKRVQGVSTLLWRFYSATAPLHDRYRAAVPDSLRVRLSRLAGRQTRA